MYIWRILILPYIDQVELYKEYKFDEPWDGPTNQPRCFKVCHWGTKKGQRVRDGFNPTKSVSFLDRYAEVSRQATYR